MDLIRSVAKYWKDIGMDVVKEPMYMVLTSRPNATMDNKGTPVYVNYGRHQDFGYFRNVDLHRTVVIVRTGKITIGEKVRNAERMGAAAVVVFIDASDVAPRGEEQPFPESIWVGGSAIQRGSAAYIRGDPLTPGYPAVDRFVMIGSQTHDDTRGSAHPLLSVTKLLIQSKVFCHLHKHHRWTPRRSLMFALFYAEENSLMGSTEWVEEYMGVLQNSGVLYLTGGMLSGTALIIGRHFSTRTTRVGWTFLSGPLQQSAEHFVESAREFMNWTQKIKQGNPMYARIYNDIVVRLPKVFLTPSGVPTRHITHKHLLFSPEGLPFPGLQDLIRHRPVNRNAFGHMVALITESIIQATEMLHFSPVV
ncbi:hypothetical protein V5799_018287 [Amblyomma americanum]|uniref:Uncharacterized protein n=1 Tax=Amblyomma americanum TaxID=6943 RepID=A0AAQ4EZY4_AMBAM